MIMWAHFGTRLYFLHPDAWPILNASSRDHHYQNPKLLALKELILKAFEEERDSYAILFTKTKLSTEVLMKWVNEDPDLKWLKAVRLTGVSSEDSWGK